MWCWWKYLAEEKRSTLYGAEHIGITIRVDPLKPFQIGVRSTALHSMPDEREGSYRNDLRRSRTCQPAYPNDRGKQVPVPR
jgi:hypothetical protein